MFLWPWRYHQKPTFNRWLREGSLIRLRRSHLSRQYLCLFPSAEETRFPARMCPSLLVVVSRTADLENEEDGPGQRTAGSLWAKGKSAAKLSVFPLPFLIRSFQRSSNYLLFAHHKSGPSSLSAPSPPPQISAHKKEDGTHVQGRGSGEAKFGQNRKIPHQQKTICFNRASCPQQYFST